MSVSQYVLAASLAFCSFYLASACSPVSTKMMAGTLLVILEVVLTNLCNAAYQYIQTKQYISVICFLQDSHALLFQCYQLCVS